jgi:adenylate cyclase
MARQSGDPHDAGKQALAALRRKMTERLVEALDQREPDLLDALDEVGAVRREWVDDPLSGPISAPPAEVVERFLERKVERKPSLVAALGLSAIQLLGSSELRGITAGETTTTERLTVMFTDLEGFTRFTAKQGDEAAGELLNAHHRAVGPIIRRRGGKIIKRLGDGLLLTFHQPAAAVEAAAELIGTDPRPLRLRAGVHLGDVMVVHEDILGHTVNVAARVAELARGGQLLLTAEVRDAVVDELTHLTFTRVRRRHVKGLDEPIGICRMVFG